MAAEYNQDQPSGLRSELDEPRRTTDEVKNDDNFGTPDQQPEKSYFPTSGGYGGVTEDEPPHHKIHTDDEPLPKPKSGTYDEELPSSESYPSKEEQVIPKPTSTEEYGDAPKSTEEQEFHDSEPSRFDGKEEVTNGGYADPNSAFPGAPVDRKVEEPGYGYDQKTSEPVLESTTPAETGTPKKEGFMTKIKEKLPGHHKSADTAEHDTAVEHDTTGAPPKKGLITKIKEKLPGHHAAATTTTE